MSSGGGPHRAHLVGSVPLDDAETVFRTVCAAIGPRLRRLTDGETGQRQRWIWFQREMLANHPAMEIDQDTPPFALYQWDGQLLRETPYIRFKPGADLAQVRFETGYAAAALESYRLFARLQTAGVIGAATRFQVSLPTPMATAYMYVSPDSRPQYLPVCERETRAALDEILAGIPPERLSIQWDVCQEVLLFEDYFSHRPSDYRTQVFGQLSRLGAAVPEPVELGYHLCYGSPRDEHLVNRRIWASWWNWPTASPPGCPAAWIFSTPRCRKTAAMGSISRRWQGCNCRRKRRRFWGCCTTMMRTATGRASPPPAAGCRSSPSPPSAAGAAPTRPECPACWKATAPPPSI